MSGQYEVILAGEGGQGLVVAGLLLGEAAVVFENRFATQTVDYGIASRGGFAMAEVKVSDEPIDCPELTAPDITVTLTAEAFRRLRTHATTGIVVYDSDIVPDDLLPEARDGLRGYPLTTTFRQLVDKHGERARVNILALGLVLGLEPVVRSEALERALVSRFGGRDMDTNRELLQAGMELSGSVNTVGG